MESVCFCCHPEKEQDSQDSQRQRLIGESKSEPQYGTTSSDRYSVISKEPKSARQHRPTTHERDCDQSVESLDEAAEIKLKEIPIQSIHKRFQDQTNLYNDVLDNYKSLRSAVHSFKELFEKDTGGIPVWGDCMKILRQRCGNAEIEVIRRKHSVELKYDDKDLSRNTDLSIDSIIPALELFNRINKLIRNSLERCPHVHSGLKMLLAEESSVKDTCPLKMAIFCKYFQKVKFKE